jgi:hypothetical protein
MRRPAGSTLRAIAVVLAAGALTVAGPTPPTSAATCRVTDLATGQTSIGHGANLQTAIDEAHVGARLEVRGVCHGNFKIRTPLRLVGRPTAAHAIATLDADGHGHVLVTWADATIRSIRIRGGWARTGGGILVRDGTLALTGDTRVRGNRASSGGGISVGDEAHAVHVLLRGRASVRGNRARYGGGVVVAFTSSITLEDRASLWNNRARVGGGVASSGQVTMRNEASIRRNRAALGGGLIDDAGGTLLRHRAQITHNVARDEGGGIFQINHPVLYVCSRLVRISPNTPDDPPPENPC